MKLNAIKQVCSAAEQFFIYNEAGGRQWIGTEQVCYPVDGIHITERSIGSLFDLDEKKLGKYTVKEVPFEKSRLCPKSGWEHASRDMTVQHMIPLCARGCVHKPLEWDRTLYLIELNMLKAVESTGAYMRFAKAENSIGATLIVVSEGFIETAIITPGSPELVKMAKKYLKYMAFLRNEYTVERPDLKIVEGDQTSMEEERKDAQNE